ncbi:hypothetical protein QWY82_16355 [Simiduia curdlanivorans]|uniref:DUF2796 domain-containing protein n=1 Tax=Simiduia curdlanivorans TaxID=1492769 RepID=A0ABV8V0R7_9GAMM|nr:hypothetical protein [Simiduia curdlanivorans]MDN3640368.1 hypothetical protein [Simiduia curdlanivorans]
MANPFKRVNKLTRGLCLCLLFSPLVQAHLMVAQHGTLNIVDDGAFMVLSLAISSFQGIDDDNSGDINLLEFNRHRAEIVQAVKREITLQDAEGQCALEGVMLSPVTDHQALQDTTTQVANTQVASTQVAITQVTIMGRFSLAAPTSPLTLRIGLYGKHPLEKLMEVSARRKAAMEVNQFSPESPQGKFFTSN